MIPPIPLNLGKTQNSPFRSQLGTLFWHRSYLNFFARIIMAPLTFNLIEKELHPHGDAGSLFLVLSLVVFHRPL